MAPQLATVDVALNAFYGLNAQPYHQIPPSKENFLPPFDCSSGECTIYTAKAGHCNQLHPYTYCTYA